jgi:hypothetical protein
MINSHWKVEVGVYWDDVGVPAWKLSGWSKTRLTISSKNCEKCSLSTLGVARYVRGYWDRRADAGCCVLLSAPAQGRPRKSEGPTPRCTNITTVFFSQMSKPANEESLLYQKCHQVSMCSLHVATQISYVELNFFSRHLSLNKAS